MASLKQLKEKRQSINKTRKVTRAMEAVSAVKMRKSQEMAISAKPYAEAALRILLNIADAESFIKNPLVSPMSSGKTGVLLITSDKGLAGSLNSAVLKKAQKVLSEIANSDVVAISLGRRGNDFFKRKGIEVSLYQENKNDEVTEEEMKTITEKILEIHLSGQTKEWFVIYTNFKSTFEQDPQILKLFPLSKESIQELINSIAPEKGKFSEPEKSYTPSSHTIEAETEKDVVSFLVPMLANIIIYHSLLESKASEHSARMVAMKNATDKAGEISHLLQLQFNKARQAAITREVSEITSGIEAMK